MAARKTAARAKRPAGGGPAAAPVRRRLPAAERERRIVEAAAAAFAELGFAASTRTLARRMGVAQALLYRYFPSKEALIARVFAHVFLDRWDPAWERVLSARERPLAERLSAFYVGFFERLRPVAMRLFTRANLDGLDFARRYAPPLTERYLAPVVRELRHAAGLPGFEARPLLRGERELALMLHGSIVFLGIRRHIYAMDLPGIPDELVAAHVRLFLGGAPDLLATMHRMPEDTPLAQAYAAPPPGPR